MSSLEIINLSASINGTEILKSLSLKVPKGGSSRNYGSQRFR